MSDLAEYLAKQARLEELERLVIKQAKEIRTCRKLINKHKANNKKLREKYGLPVAPSRCERARKLIARREAGELDIKLTEIAAQCYLGYSTVKALARDWRAANTS